MMPSFDQALEEPKKSRVIKSAFDSDSFEADCTIHVNGVVGSATISPSGRDVALASPEGLAIIDLDSPYSPPRKLRSPGQPWLVVDVQWSPFAARDYWVVSTANHRALVWNLNMREDSSSGSIEHSLQGHSRAITDVNFSAHHPDLLATCSVDGYVHSWDLRRPRQPVLTFCDWFAGATQVKYNRQDPHVLASAHDRWLHIWDERRACEPIRSITAHTSKIYGIDWNRTRSTGIVTCSLDKSIKFWDYSTDGIEPEHVIKTEFPVWRARHTPFGWGLLAMPQNEPGDLYLYDRLWSDDSPVDASPAPVAVFPGHGDFKAKEFLWRTRGNVSEDGMDFREFQMVSWGGDNELRLHCVDANVLASVGHVKGGRARRELKLTRKGATYKTFRTIEDASNRDRKSGTMSDHRSSGGFPQKHSAITSSIHVSHTGGRHSRPLWRGPSMKARVTSNKAGDRDQSQIGWMKGITMNKRKISADGSRHLTPRNRTILEHGFPDGDWGEPDTIQEELLRISTKIPKVNWENIDMDNLTLNASLSGPWGTDGEPIFIQVKIDIPPEYPKSKPPRFLVEKSSFMPEETHRRINREVQELAGQFLHRKQNCLEVAFTYLLGEVDLESSTSFFKNVRDLDDDLGGLADDSSSSEDEDIPAGGSASMSQDLGQAGDTDTAIAAPSRIILPPPSRTCGARFSSSGRLLCFFPTKEEKARTLYSATGDLFRDRSKGEPFFAGFGRLNHEAGSRQKYRPDDASTTEDQSETSDSEESSSGSSTSDSESTSSHNVSIWYRPSRHLRKTWSEDRSIKSSGAGTGTGVGTGTGTGASRRRVGRPRNVVSIHDMRADLPSKKELAEGYAIFGDGADVCEHNARVAETLQMKDLMHVWQYLALLLRKGIPLKIAGVHANRSSVLVIARETVLNGGTGVARGARNHAQQTENNLVGRVKWGQHPLAKTIVADLFNYFESIADIQMLAMLSCIFSETSTDDGVAYFESHLPQQETPLPLKAPSFSLDYFPHDAAAWHRYNQSFTNSAVTTPGALHTPVYLDGSQTSEDGLWTGETGVSYSCGETPPTKSKPFTDSAYHTTSISKSPNTRPLQKVNSGLASAFTANFTRPFVGAVSSSPPAHGKKKPSPAEAILNSFAPRTGSSGPVSSAAATESGVGRNSISEEDYRMLDTLPLIPISTAVVLEDQAIFDDDGWHATPVLDSSSAALHANYRYAYAELLQMWEQPLPRLEVLKFNVLRDDATGTLDYPSLRLNEASRIIATTRGSSPIAMGKREQLQALATSGRGLDVTGICQIHETQLEPSKYYSMDIKVGGAVGTCDRCRRTQTQLRCVYCLEPVDALFPPCLSCGCASHEECLSEWHAAGETYCPAGDECKCVEEAANGQIESWAALRGAMMKGTPQAASITRTPPVADKEETSLEKERGRLWRRGEPAAAAASPAGLGFGSFRRGTGTWSRLSSQRRTAKQG